MKPTLILAALLVATPALAAPQTAPQTTPQTAPQTSRDAELRQRGETYSRASDAEQDPSEVAATQRLNAEIAAGNAAADQADMDNQATYDAAVAAQADAGAASSADQARYESDVAAYESAKAEHDRAYAAWEGLIRACEASGRRDCRVNAPN